MMSLINKDQILFFETDEEFEEFVVAPYATKDLRGQYSEAYKEWVKQGKYFVINGGSLDSNTNKRKVVTKRVLVPPEVHSTRKEVVIQLPVRNIGRIIFANVTFYQVKYDGKILYSDNDDVVCCPEAAAHIMQKYAELYGPDHELQALASSIGRRDDEALKMFVSKVCKQKAFKEKLEVTPFVYFTKFWYLPTELEVANEQNGYKSSIKHS